VAWVPLVFGQGPLTPENGFHSQADIAIETRRAADLLGATPLDRPEGVAIDPRAAPHGGKIYLSLTKNQRRSAEGLDAVNSRAANLWGQIIELTAPGGDHAAERFSWDILVACGNPAEQQVAARWHRDISPGGWFACPDNLALDSAGRLWVATDQDAATHWPDFDPTMPPRPSILAITRQGGGRIG
jgi:hypothetical protein